MTYHAPTSVNEAISLLTSQNDARPMAGGTDLLVQMRSGRLKPGAIVDIKHIDRANGTRAENGGFVIGATMGCA